MKVETLSNIKRYPFWAHFLSSFGIFLFLDITKWIPLRFWGATSGEHFVDTQQILNSAGCVDSNLSFKMTELCSNYIYGISLIRSIHWFHISPLLTGLIGYLFLGILAAVLAEASYRSGTSKLIYLAVILSPPVILLSERANFDILMLALVFMAALLSHQDRVGYSTVILAIASLIKFYTAPLMLLVSVSSKKRISRVSAFSLASIVLLQVADEIFGKKLSASPQTENVYNNGSGFGFDIWSGYLPRFRGLIQINEKFVGYVLSSSIVLLLILATMWAIKKGKINTSLKTIHNPKAYRVFEFFLATHLSCYFAGVSIDYRLIFIVCGSLSYLSSLRPIENWCSEKSAVTGLLLVSLWCTYPSDGLQFIGDLSLTLLTLLLAARALQFRLAKNRTCSK